MPIFSNKNTAQEEVSRSSKAWENIRSFGFAVALALIFRSLFFEPFHIPSGSMRATLLEGDYIFVTKYAYGYSRYSFPFGARIGYFDGRLFGDLPERGDVVVFRLPRDTTVDYIKRVMALPGDTIQVRNGEVYLNGERLQYEKTESFTFQESSSFINETARYLETLPNGAQHAVLDATVYGEVDQTPVYTVPEGHVFVMGDNRDHSIDSRYQDQVGFVPVENILGRADVILFGLDTTGSGIFREGRFLKAIE